MGRNCQCKGEKNSCFETFKIQNYYKTNVTILRDNYIDQDELPQADEA